MRSRSVLQVAFTVVLIGIAARAEAQFPNWDGQTGAVITPSAQVLLSPSTGIGRPVVGFRLLNGGDLIGDRFQISLTAGFLERVEVGFTRSAVSSGDDFYSSLFDRGFSNVHAKVVLLPETVADGWPVIAAGFVTRWQQEHIAGGLGVATQNADIFVVATKDVRIGADTVVRATGGVKFTNASLFGIAGNAPEWTSRGFGAASVAFGGIIELGGEVVQQPGEIDGFTGADIPTTVTTFARFMPAARRLAIDLAIVRLAGEIAPGLDVDATNRIVLGASYRF